MGIGFEWGSVMTASVGLSCTARGLTPAGSARTRDPGRGGYPVGRMLSTALTSRIDGGTM